MRVSSALTIFTHLLALAGFLSISLTGSVGLPLAVIFSAALVLSFYNERFGKDYYLGHGLSNALALLLAGSTALAHPDHKILGTVTMISADHVMLKDRAGKEITVKLVKTTKVTKNKKTVKASDITASSPDERGSFFDPAADKVYRHPTFYDVPEDVEYL